MARSAYYGSRGDAVKQIQRDLNAQGANLEVDGIWGVKALKWGKMDNFCALFTKFKDGKWLSWQNYRFMS